MDMKDNTIGDAEIIVDFDKITDLEQKELNHNEYLQDDIILRIMMNSQLKQEQQMSEEQDYIIKDKISLKGMCNDIKDTVVNYISIDK